MVDVTDFSSLMYEFLRENAKASAVRNTLVAGKDSIVEVGGLNEGKIRSNFETRLADAELSTRALFIVVQDAGDEQGRGQGLFENYVVLRILDRGFGYRNIRRVKAQIMLKVVESLGNVLTGYGGVTAPRYSGRTGHRYDPVFAVEYDALTFAAVHMWKVY